MGIKDVANRVGRASLGVAIAAALAVTVGAAGTVSAGATVDDKTVFEAAAADSISVTVPAATVGAWVNASLGLQAGGVSVSRDTSVQVSETTPAVKATLAYSGNTSGAVETSIGDAVCSEGQPGASLVVRGLSAGAEVQATVEADGEQVAHVGATADASGTAVAKVCVG